VAVSNEPYPFENLPIYSALNGRPAAADDIEANLGDRKVPIEIWASPVRDSTGEVESAVAAFLDIGQRKQAEAEVRAGAARYRTLFELVPVAVYTTDAEGHIQEFNHRATALWGRKPADKHEKFCGSFKIFYPDGRLMAHDQCPMARVLRGEQLQASDLEIIVEQENGTRRHVVVAPQTLHDERGHITGAINCLHDITYRKHAEEMISEA
jgi:PAS domain S-box-containing protein